MRIGTRSFARLLALALSFVVAGLASTQAPAGAAQPAVITDLSPSGGSVPLGWSGPVSFQVTADGFASVSIRAQSTEVPYDTGDVFVGSIDTAGTRSFNASFPDGLDDEGTYVVQVDVRQYNRPTVTRSVQLVVGDAPVVTRFTLTDSRIYSTVRDGYLDDVEIDWDSEDSLDASSRIEILAPGGVVVASKDSQFGDGFLTWAGNAPDGRPLPAGRYVVRLTVRRDATGLTTVATRPVEVATGVRWESRSRTRYGSQATARRATRGCSVTRFAGIGLSLECDGGRQARATWRFAVPSQARDLRFRAEEFALSFPGRLKRTGKRINAGTYAVTISVSGRRGVEIDAVRVRFQVPVRI